MVANLTCQFLSIITFAFHPLLFHYSMRVWASLSFYVSLRIRPSVGLSVHSYFCPSVCSVWPFECSFIDLLIHPSVYPFPSSLVSPSPSFRPSIYPCQSAQRSVTQNFGVFSSVFFFFISLHLVQVVSEAYASFGHFLT